MGINVINSIMGRLNDVNQMIVQAVRYGKDDVVDILEASSFGMGGNPPKNTPLIAVQTDRGLFIVGAVTQKLDLKPGESALHGFSEDGKNIESFVKASNNGEIHVNGDSDNMVLFSEMKKSFDELKNDVNKLINLYNTHTHPSNGAPTANVTTVSSADISPAKSQKNKLS